MNAQSFLALIRDHYHFEHAQNVLANTQIKSLWESWFSADLLHTLTRKKVISNIETDSPYPAFVTNEPATAASSAKEKSLTKAQFLSVKPGEPEAKQVEKRHASRADFAFLNQANRLYCEGFCAHVNGEIEPKNVRRMSDLLQRARKLTAQNETLNIISFGVWYGFIESGQMPKLKPLDNSRTFSYVLDTHIQGSSSIARLSAVSNVETPRILVIASSM